MTHEPLLRLAHISHGYSEGGRRRTVLENLDLEAGRGECVALIGRSGSGKSTLLNLIAGIDRAASGSVIIEGRSLTDMNERDRTLFRRRHIGFVYQFFNLIPTLTVAENLLLPLELNGTRDEAAQQRVHDLLAGVDLGDRGDSFPDRLSGGEQQRVAIARALVHRPALVLADEPTGNLDAETGRQVLSLLRELVRTTGTTLILVTHSREVARFADRRLVLQEGRLHEYAEEAGW
jgi:putative ABC transport system ATP-binding protein